MDPVIYKDHVYTYNGFTWHPNTNIRKAYKTIVCMHNDNLICFKNGVYELDTMIFRPTKFDDYCRYNTYYNYKEMYHDTFFKTLASSFENINQYKLFMRYMYALFIGKRIHVHVNRCIQSLVDILYGGYILNVDGTTLSNRKLYRSITNLEYITENFNGKGLFIIYSEKDISLCTSPTSINDKTSQCIDKFKMNYYDIPKNERLIFMTRLMDIHKGYKKCMGLNQIIINDVAKIIIDFYIELLL